MRASSWRWSSVGITLSCFLLAGVTGCKTGGSGINWLSWGQKPSTTALSSAARPSANALPGPSATTNTNGLANSGARPYGQAGYQSGQAAPGGYQTGQYSTGSGTRNYPAGSSSVAGVPTSGYGTPSATGPYQSPYQSGQAANTGSYSGYTTADARGGTGYPNSTSTVTPASPAGSSWNSGQWRRGADASSAAQPAANSAYGRGTSSYSGTAPSASPYGGTSTGQSGYNPSANYGTTSGSSYPQTSPASGATGGYQQPATYEQPRDSAPQTASRAWASDLGETNYPSTPGTAPSTASYPSSTSAADSSAGLSGSTTPGAWRPGSTARNASALDGQSAPTTQQPASGYPTTNSAYPTTTGGSTYGYPSTGQ